MIKSYILFTIIILLGFTTCTQQTTVQKKPKEDAIKLNNEAMELLGKIDSSDTQTLDKCLKLLNEAINIDNSYYMAYCNKNMVLGMKGDLQGQIENNSKLIELRPLQPIWKIQRGVFLELEGNLNEANEFYKSGLQQYEELLKDTSLYNDFNFRLEYVTTLETVGQLEQAKGEFEKLFKQFPDNVVLIEFKASYIFRSKDEIFKELRGYYRK